MDVGEHAIGTSERSYTIWDNRGITTLKHVPKTRKYRSRFDKKMRSWDDEMMTKRDEKHSFIY